MSSREDRHVRGHYGTVMSAETSCPEAVSIHSRAMNQVWEDQGCFPGQVAFKLRPQRISRL